MGFDARQIENSIRTLNFLVNNNDVPIGSYNAIIDGINALRSEIPSKPVYLKEFGEYVCNECGGGVERGNDYCCCCGKKQEWRDEE